MLAGNRLKRSRINARHSLDVILDSAADLISQQFQQAEHDFILHEVASADVDLNIPVLLLIQRAKMKEAPTKAVRLQINYAVLLTAPFAGAATAGVVAADVATGFGFGV